MSLLIIFMHQAVVAETEQLEANSASLPNEDMKLILLS